MTGPETAVSSVSVYDAILTNDSAIVEGQSIGDPTEVALLEMGRKVDIKEDILKEMMPRMEEIPFDSDRKLMSTKYRLHGVPTIWLRHLGYSAEANGQNPYRG